MKEKNIQAAKAVFEKNAEVTEMYFTDDGQAFYKPGPAIVHQREIGGKKENIQKVAAGTDANKTKEAAVIEEGALPKSEIKVDDDVTELIAAEKVKEEADAKKHKGKDN